MRLNLIYTTSTLCRFVISFAFCSSIVIADGEVETERKTDSPSTQTQVVVEPSNYYQEVAHIQRVLHPNGRVNGFDFYDHQFIGYSLAKKLKEPVRYQHWLADFASDDRNDTLLENGTINSSSREHVVQVLGMIALQNPDLLEGDTVVDLMSTAKTRAFQTNSNSVHLARFIFHEKFKGDSDEEKKPDPKILLDKELPAAIDGWLYKDSPNAEEIEKVIAAYEKLGGNPIVLAEYLYRFDSIKAHGKDAADILQRHIRSFIQRHPEPRQYGETILSILDKEGVRQSAIKSLVESCVPRRADL